MQTSASVQLQTQMLCRSLASLVSAMFERPGLKQTCALTIVLLTSLLVSTIAAGCRQGDAKCACRTVEGVWLATPTTIRSLCRKTMQYQGIARVVDIYFPQNIQTSGTSYTPWIYLHGIHHAEWFVSDNPQWQHLRQRWPIPLAGNAQAAQMGVLTGTDITCSSSSRSTNRCAGDGGGLLRTNSSILVVPQATGSPAQVQMWNSGYWPCVSQLSACVHPNIDDVGFVSMVIHNMQQLLNGIPVSSKLYLSGYSNGGMLLQALLCQRPNISEQLAGIAVIASALSATFVSCECARELPGAVPLLWIHGNNDSVLLYKPGLSEGISMLGIENTVALWASRLGCSAEDTSRAPIMYQDPPKGVICREYCQLGRRQQQKDNKQQTHRQQQQQQTRQQHVVLCTVSGGTHFVYESPAAGYAAGLALWGLRSFHGRPEPFS